MFILTKFSWWRITDNNDISLILFLEKRGKKKDKARFNNLEELRKF